MTELNLTVGPPGRAEVGDVDDDGELVVDDGLLEDEAPEAHPDTIRNVLAAIGMGVGAVVGDDDVPDHWRFTDRELDALVPPFTSIVNRTPALRAAVAKGDYAVIAIHLAAYGGRNMGDLKRAQRNRGEHLDPEAQGGVDARHAVDRGPWGGEPSGGDAAGVRDGVPGA